eukprot:CAMPEP_0181212490 /NCGR_PEP_ID=MMETSP1096-20121128/24376_1 /TAXON_ID=156174 ORGANISM="Chrysochromulina ericina, Strain CCMP281" /NCGR_SAMPLE_ID=MMETSP1096 /ASSEMBLY_ACC=CAM_ASM_000453 /LENGTH=154 /DNA_ID=CAMNT_0023304019 /DNA_START=201 /DNA_END=666 /DNA_ORIENTATION=-
MVHGHAHFFEKVTACTQLAPSLHPLAPHAHGHMSHTLAQLSLDGRILAGRLRFLALTTPVPHAPVQGNAGNRHRAHCMARRLPCGKSSNNAEPMRAATTGSRPGIVLLPGPGSSSATLSAVLCRGASSSADDALRGRAPCRAPRVRFVQWPTAR